MFDIETLIAQYGYIVLLIGSLLEGETVIILGGFAAHQALLAYPLVVLCAFLGGVIGDTFFYMLGRHYGMAMLSRFHKHQKRIEYLRQRIRYHQNLAIFSVRFLYGLRIIGPVLIGASHVKFRRFVLFNLLGSIVWAFIFTTGGYLFGIVLTQWFKRFNHFFYGFIAIAVIIAIFIWWFRRYLRDSH